MIVHGMTEWCLRQSQAMYFVAMYFAVTSLCTYEKKKAFYSEEAPPPFATLGDNFIKNCNKKTKINIPVPCCFQVG